MAKTLDTRSNNFKPLGALAGLSRRATAESRRIPLLTARAKEQVAAQTVSHWQRAVRSAKCGRWHE
jgi:hypothetical protein